MRVAAAGVPEGAKPDSQRLSESDDEMIARRAAFLTDYQDAAYASRYTDFVARTAEASGWSWAYWQFDSDFILYDMKRDGWVEPILAALVLSLSLVFMLQLLVRQKPAGKLEPFWPGKKAFCGSGAFSGPSWFIQRSLGGWGSPSQPSSSFCFC